MDEASLFIFLRISGALPILFACKAKIHFLKVEIFVLFLKGPTWCMDKIQIEFKDILQLINETFLFL